MKTIPTKINKYNVYNAGRNSISPTELVVC